MTHDRTRHKSRPRRARLHVVSAIAQSHKNQNESLVLISALHSLSVLTAPAVNRAPTLKVGYPQTAPSKKEIENRWKTSTAQPNHVDGDTFHPFPIKPCAVHGVCLILSVWAQRIWGSSCSGWSFRAAAVRQSTSCFFWYWAFTDELCNLPLHPLSLTIIAWLCTATVQPMAKEFRRQALHQAEICALQSN